MRKQPQTPYFSWLSGLGCAMKMKRAKKLLTQPLDPKATAPVTGDAKMPFEAQYTDSESVFNPKIRGSGVEVFFRVGQL